jgi:hypothetical protein
MLALLGAAAACHTAPARPAACPVPYASDAALEARIDRMLSRDPEAGPLLQRAPDDLALCFSPAGRGVVSGDTLFLDARQSPEELGARVAHLLYHLSHGQARTSGNADDPSEAPARALEARVLDRLSRAAQR